MAKENLVLFGFWCSVNFGFLGALAPPPCPAPSMPMDQRRNLEKFQGIFLSTAEVSNLVVYYFSKVYLVIIFFVAITFFMRFLYLV